MSLSFLNLGIRSCSDTLLQGLEIINFVMGSKTLYVYWVYHMGGVLPFVLFLKCLKIKQIVYTQKIIFYYH